MTRSTHVIAVTAALLIAVGCKGKGGGSDGPTEDQMVGAVQKLMVGTAESQEFARPGNSLGFCKIKSIKSVGFAKAGIYNDQARYWPMKAVIAGRCVGPAFTAPGQDAPSMVEEDFKGIIDFRVTRDDFGKYQAERVPGTDALVPGSSSAAPARTAVQLQPFVWTTDEVRARAAAAAEKKPMIIDFTAEWCAACKELEKNTYTSEKFWKAAERFVGLRIDGTDQDNEIFDRNSKTYGVQGLPAVVILDSKGQQAKIFKKKPETEELIAALEAVK